MEEAQKIQKDSSDYIESIYCCIYFSTVEWYTLKIDWICNKKIYFLKKFHRNQIMKLSFVPKWNCPTDFEM